MSKRGELAKKALDLSKKLEDILNRALKQKGWTNDELRILEATNQHIGLVMGQISDIVEENQT